MMTCRVSLIAVLLAAAVASAQESRQLRVVVHVPENTPAGEMIYLAGSLPSVGEWRADGVKLARQADGTYAADIAIQSGQTLEYKITRGSWEAVEKFADGSERPNRTVTIDPDTKRIEITVEHWADSNADVRTARTTVTGDLRLHQLDSTALKAARTIRVWLPPDYNADTTRRYSVLYMHDGQNLFDRATSAFDQEWQIDETLSTLVTDKTIPPIIVVGLDNGQASRIAEYTYAADARHGGGGGAEHARFLLDEVMPFIASNYRVSDAKEQAYIGGSSLGAIISLEIARRHPDSFAGVVAMSPALWWADEQLTREIEADPAGLKGTRIWLDIGTPEAMGSAGGAERFVAATRRLAAALEKHGIAHHLMVEEGAEHNERAWAKRFWRAIVFLLGAQ
jgi:predicted alpha/beta superfamily hydrolase